MVRTGQSPRVAHLMRVKGEIGKAGLKLNIQKKLRSWHLVPSLHGKQKGETVETVADLILLGSKIIDQKQWKLRDLIFAGSKITADGDCSHEIKRSLLLGKQTLTNLDSVLKSRDITLVTKVHLVKAMVFPVVMYGCESWTIKKAECQKIDVVLEKTLKSGLDSKESQPVNPKGKQSGIFIGRTDTKAPILWLPTAKN